MGLVLTNGKQITWLLYGMVFFRYNMRNSSMCYNTLHCGAWLVPLYFDTALPQSNTRCPLQLMSFFKKEPPSKTPYKLFACGTYQKLQPTCFLCSQHMFSSSDTHLHYFDCRFQNCVYTYRILPNEDKKLSVQVGWQLDTSQHCVGPETD